MTVKVGRLSIEHPALAGSDLADAGLAAGVAKEVGAGLAQLGLNAGAERISVSLPYGLPRERMAAAIVDAVRAQLGRR